MPSSDWTDRALLNAAEVTQDLLRTLPPADQGPHRRALRLYGAELSRRGFDLPPGGRTET